MERWLLQDVLTIENLPFYKGGGNGGWKEEGSHEPKVAQTAQLIIKEKYVLMEHF